jgi:hypothetical protein
MVACKYGVAMTQVAMPVMLNRPLQAWSPANRRTLSQGDATQQVRCVLLSNFGDQRLRITVDSKNETATTNAGDGKSSQKD